MAPTDDGTPLATAAEALRVYEQIVSAVPDHLSFVGRDHVYHAVNDAYLLAHGTERRRIVGHSVLEVMGAKAYERTVGPMLDRCLMGETINYVAWFDFTGKGRRLMDCSYIPYRDRDDTVQGVVVAARDVTERHELEEQLRHSQKMDALGRLAGGIAHDFNNLLTVILSYTEIQERRISTQSSLHGLVTPVREAAQRAASLTEQLLAFARKQVVQPRVVDVNRLVEELGRLLGRVVGDDVRVSEHLDADVGPIEIDSGQFEQVLLNLAINARDAMPDGGDLRISTSKATVDDHAARVRGVSPGRWVRIRVEDTGRGIDPDDLPRVFDPFFTTKQSRGGSGLGLATCHGIVVQNGGFIDIDSELERGTVVDIHMPRSSGEPQEERRSPVPQAPEGSGTILVAEDDDSVRPLAVEALRERGYTVIAAHDGVEALRRVDGLRSAIDALVTDIVMPKLGGVELARRLRRERPELPVLFVSGYADDAVDRDALSSEPSAFLSKPYTANLLAERLHVLLAGR